jgi:NTP pyrophosphatase (non-canonical NTP hydrolase)
MTNRPREFLVWATKTFGAVARDPRERALRFFEEAAELAQAAGLEQSLAVASVARVYSRPAGDLRKEVGQAAATLETFAENIGLNASDEAQREWERVQSIPQEEWDRRHKAKVDLGLANVSIPKPTPDQAEYLETIVDASKYDPEVIIGGPKTGGV